MDYIDIKSSETFLVSLKAFIVNEGKLLILQPQEDDHVKFRNRWGLPGGLLEMNENIATGLIREIKEETSLTVKIEGLLAVGEYTHKDFKLRDGRQLRARIVELGFGCRYEGGDVSTSHEHCKYIWATKEQLKKLQLTPDSAQLIEHYLKNY